MIGGDVVEPVNSDDDGDGGVGAVVGVVVVHADMAVGVVAYCDTGASRDDHWAFGRSGSEVILRDVVVSDSQSVQR